MKQKNNNEKKTEKRTEIYPFRAEQYQTAQKTLNSWNGSQRNKDLINEFIQHIFAKGSKGNRAAKLIMELKKISVFLNKDLDKTTYKDIERFVAYTNQRSDYSEWTKTDYKKALKNFYRWYEDEDPRLNGEDKTAREEAVRLYKYIEKNVKGTVKFQNIDYSQVITDEDIQHLINEGCKNVMEKAVISLLHESGCRVGELLGIRIRDIEFKNKHALIKVDGKTGERRIPIAQSLSWLLRWLDEHPDKNNPNSLLWISKGNKHYGQPLRYMGIVRLLERVAEASEFKKPINPHWMRHSRASIIAPKYSEAVLCKMMGWTLGSKQVRTYVHLGAGQVEDAFLTNHGIKEQIKETPKILFCSCGVNNDPNSRYCYKCGKPLTVATVIEDEEKKNAAIDESFQLMTRIMSDPDLREKFEAFVKNGGGSK